MSSRRNKNVRVSMHGDAGSGGLTAPFHPHQLMLNGSKHDLINAKSQYEAEFRRFAIDASLLNTVEKLHTLLGELHGLNQAEFYITYIDKTDGELLPINNDDNYAQALRSYAPPSVLRIHIQRKDQEGRLSAYHHNGGGGRYSDSPGSRTPFRSLLMSRDHQINNYNSNSGGSASANLRRRNNQHHQPGNLLQIGRPENFRPVSSIIDADILPETLRRVKMMKHNNERPLGFYIRDGVCVRPTSNGIEKVPGIYISRVVQGGLAESTGLLNVDDEVLEVNGIEVEGKTLDQVTDMMIANSSNLILTIKPANQGHISWSGGAAAGGTMGDRSSASKLSRGSAHGSASSSRSSGAGSGGASESLPRRAHANNSSITKESYTKTTKMPVVAESNRNGVGTSAGGGGTSWGDAKFRTSQISQVSAASSSAASAASSSSMSIGGNVAGAGGGGAGSGASNHSPYDADDMDEVREFPSNTAAALEAINRQQLKQQQQQPRNSGMYRGSQSDYALSTTAAAATTAVNVATRRDAPPPRRERDQPQYQPQQQSSSNTDFGFNNPAFNESMQAEYAAGDAAAAASTTKNGSVKGRRSLRNNVVGGTDAASRNNSNGESSAAAAAAGSSARSSAMDTF